MAPDKYRLPDCVRARDSQELRRAMLRVQLKTGELYHWQISWTGKEWVAWYPAPLELANDPNQVKEA